jgi:hypothetical protein
VAAEALAEAPPQDETPEAATPTPAPAPPAPPTEAGRPAAAKARQAKVGKGGKESMKKKESAADDQGEDGNAPSVAAHPRARRAVARSKGWGGLLGFVIASYMALPTNTLAAAALRALIAGVVCYVAVWAGAVFVWRRLVILELKNREQRLFEAANPRPRGELPPGPSAGAAT